MYIYIYIHVNMYIEYIYIYIYIYPPQKNIGFIKNLERPLRVESRLGRSRRRQGSLSALIAGLGTTNLLWLPPVASNVNQAW